MARILELGGHNCPATEEEYDALQKICDAGQMGVAPCLKDINDVGEVRWNDPRLRTVAQAIAVDITHVGQAEGPPPENWLREDFEGLRALVSWGRVSEQEESLSRGGILIRVAPLLHPERPRPEGGVNGGIRPGETRVASYEGLNVGTLVVSIKGGAFSRELGEPARSSSLGSLLGLPSPCQLESEAQGREWLVGGQRYPIVRASNEMLKIPEGYVGRVVLHDDRRETRLIAQGEESEHRHLNVKDCWQLLGLHPFSFDARGEGEADDLEQVGKLLGEIPKGAGLQIAKGLGEVRERTLALSARRRAGALEAHAALALLKPDGRAASEDEPEAVALLRKRRIRDREPQTSVGVRRKGGLPKVGGLKKASTTGGREAEDEAGATHTSRPNLFDEVQWKDKPLLVGDRRQNVLLYSHGELSVGTTDALHRRIILGGTPRPPAPTEPAYFKPMVELLVDPRGPGPDPGQQGLITLEAAVRDSEEAEEERGSPSQYHRALGEQLFVECHDGSVALPQSRDNEETFFDVTGQEWARKKPADEGPLAPNQGVRSSAGNVPSPAGADPLLPAKANGGSVRELDPRSRSSKP